jgi:hypothetical protein
METTQTQAVEMIRAVLGRYSDYRDGTRARKLAAVLAEHPEARLVKCADERTGQRFGAAACRRGRCEKIGHTGFQMRGHGHMRPYQLWAEWAEKAVRPACG